MEISNRLLKLRARPITPSLTKLFNKCLSTETFPDIWKAANITPVYKKGTKTDKTNYRPISLLPALSKVFERILFNRIYRYCEDNGILTWRNSGYKKWDSTINQLLYISDMIYKNLDNRDDTCLVFLDQSHAFDRIWHDGLIAKLKMYGINGHFANVLKSYLHNRRVCVVIEGCESHWCNITAGVPQGSILGPLLFLLYINDIINTLQTDIHLYADDDVLMCNLNATPNATDVINQDLQQLHTWAQTWYMSFNTSKTKYMIISNKYVPQAYPTIELNNVEIEKVSCFKQLGLYFDEKMTWESHIDHIVSIANKKIGLMWKVILQFPRTCAETIYASYVRPILDYGCAIYNNCSRLLSDKLECTEKCSPRMHTSLP